MAEVAKEGSLLRPAAWSCAKRSAGGENGALIVAGRWQAQTCKAVLVLVGFLSHNGGQLYETKQIYKNKQ